MVPLAFLGKLPWTAIGLVAGVLVLGALWARGSYYSRQYQTERVFSETARTINASNAKIAADREIEIKAAEHIRIATQGDLARFQAKLTESKRKAANAPPSYNGPVAPVLRELIDSLPGPKSVDGATIPAPPVHPVRYVDVPRAAAEAGARSDADGPGR